jgi:hypothetical protein
VFSFLGETKNFSKTQFNPPSCVFSHLQSFDRTKKWA